MRVIKRGTPPEEKNITCLTCDSELTYLPEDIKREYDDWGPFYTEWILCPVCNRYIVLTTGGM